MRIGMMADIYKPHISGITNYIVLNRAALEEAGHEVYIFTFGDEGYQDEETRVIRSPGLPLVDTGIYLGFRYRKAARKLLYTMDIVHVHHPFMSGSLAVRYCRPNGIPIIFTNHTRYDLYAQAYLPAVADVIGESVIQAYLPPFCRACDLVVAPSQGMRQVLTKFGVDAPVQVIPNGVDLTPFIHSVQPIDRQTFGFDKEDVILTYVGRLGPEKNLPFLLRCFAGTAHALDRARLLVVGDGSERESLEELSRSLGIASKIHFTGMVPYADLPGYLAACNAFVTASVTEVHPLSVIEAMAAGLPVLGIRSPGVGDTIEDNQTGFLSGEDIAAFTAKMVRLVSEKELRQKMGAQARLASQQYDIQRTSKAMIDVYEQLVSQSAGRRRGLRKRITRRISRLLDNWRS